MSAISELSVGDGGVESPPRAPAAPSTTRGSSKGGARGVAAPQLRRDRSFGSRRPDQRGSTHAVLDQVENSGNDQAAIAALVARAKNGDDLAFAELYVTFFDRICRYLQLALKNVHDAQEAAQEVFAKALAAIARYDDQGVPFRAWLFTIARNHAYDRLRVASRSECMAPTQIAQHQDDLAARAADLVTTRGRVDGSLAEAIAALPPLQARVIKLRFLFDLTPNEVADVVGSSPDAIRHAQHRALRSLASCLSKEESTRDKARRIKPMRGRDAASNSQQDHVTTGVMTVR